MNKLASFGLTSALLLAAPAAFPCGAPFGAGVNVDPSQDIMLVQKGDQETYVFQPTFCGDAKDFGVILPVPSMLTGEPALGDAAAFTAADTLSKPKVEKKTECRSRGGVGGALDAGSFGEPNDGTKVVSSGTVGFLDWVQLEAKDEASFTSWLDANGYPYDDQAKATFAHYVAKKWFFVAFKVSNGAAPAGEKPCKSLGPIKLTFKSATPVVPSRMGSAGATVPKPGGGSSYGFSWRVFAITDGAQELAFADGAAPTRKLGFSGKVADGDLGKLGGLATAGDRLTKLTLFFGNGISEDVGLKLAPAADYRETQYDVTYVDCDETGPIGDEDAGPGPGNSAAPESSDKGCSTSGSSTPERSSRSSGSTTFALGLALGAIALFRRRQR